MKVRRLERQEKMAQVVTVARKLFVKRGYFSVTIPDIVNASGISTGAIYQYFVNKEGLASYIHDQTIADFDEMFSQRLVGKTSTYDKLKAFADLVFDLTESDPEMMEYMLFMRHGEFMEDPLPVCFTEPFRGIQQIVAEGIESGELKKGDIFVSGIAYTGVILRAVELRLLCVLQAPLPDVAEELIANAWAAVKA